MIHLRRPLLERIVHPLMIGIMLCFIVMLALVESTEAFVEGAVGVLFGIFTVKEILMPAGVTSRVLLDYAVWGLFFAFGGALIPQLIDSIRKIRPDSGPNENDAPPDKVTQDRSTAEAAADTGQQSAKANYPGLLVLLAVLGSWLIAWLVTRTPRSRKALRKHIS